MANYNQNALYEVRRQHFIDRAVALWGDANDYTDLSFTTGKEPCIITCRKHGPFKVAMAQNHILKDSRFRTGCPYCKCEQMEAEGIDTSFYVSKVLHITSKKKQEAEEQKAIRKAEREKQRAEHKAFLEKEKEFKRKQREERLAEQHHQTLLRYEQETEERKRRSVERKEQQRLASLEKYRAKAIAVHGDAYDYSQMDYVKKMYHGKEQWVLTNIICPVHGSFETKPKVHIDLGCKCAKCAGLPNVMTADERKKMFIDRAIKKFGPNRFDYSRVEYKNRRTEVWIRCIDHDYWFKTRLDDHSRKSGGCPYCVQSSGEANIRKYLEDHNICFEAQYKIENPNSMCKRGYLVIDFYLPEQNMFIEFNGKQHYEDVPYFFDKEFTFEDQQTRDQTVRDYCKSKGIRLLEIKYFDEGKIPQILNKYICK